MEAVASSPFHRYLRSAGPWLGVAIFFVFLALSYFAPAVFEGRELFQQDVAGASGNASDVYRHMEATGGAFSYWTNSLFGGMPMYQIAPSYPSVGIIRTIQDLLTLQWPLNLLPGYSWLLFAMLGGFYLFIRSLRMDRLPAVLGAIMWTFSSYFIILITAGHIWKLMTLCFIPPTIAGIIYIYRGAYLRGGALTALFAALQILSNHVQMSYYFAFLILFLIIGYLVEAIRTHTLGRFFKATAILIGAGVIAIGINSSNLYHTYEYGQETIRGGSELTPLPSQDSKQAEANAQGLDKDYITAWSYGKGETFTFLIPNLYGGASGYLAEDASAMERANPEYREIIGGMNHYWGDQPFTAGPVYVGAFVLFLFILGVFKVQGTLKWTLLAGTIFSIALAWGHNLMWLSDLFIDYIPLYNKFRTVSSILVIAEFTIPALAVLALVQFVRDPKAFLGDQVALGVSLALTLLPCLILWLMPSTFLGLISGGEQEMFRQAMGNSELPVAAILGNLKEVRASIVSADALRSVFVILLSLGICYLYAIGKLKQSLLYLLLGGITLADLWLVDKRYLNDDLFIDKASVEAQARPVTEVDKAINADKDPHYRVMNLAVNSFNDATTSANHRSIGGYHAAKLRRYQDLIERQLAKQNMQVYNMLDTRYFIFADKEHGLQYQHNPDAFGPAWFVDRIDWVDTADAEMAALDSTDLRHVAVVDKSFHSLLPTYQPAPTQVSADSLSSTHSVTLQSYTPSEAKYQVETKEPRLLVFSEIYYPHGWHLRIDGDKELPLLRVNYTLRAAYIPAGKHELTMVFDPKSIHTTETVASISTGVLLLLFLSALLAPLLQRKRKGVNTAS